MASISAWEARIERLLTKEREQPLQSTLRSTPGHPGLAQLCSLLFYCTDWIAPDGQWTDEGWGLLAAVIMGTLSLLLYKGSRIYTPWFSKAYSRLSKEDQRNWDSRWVVGCMPAECHAT